MNEKWATTIQRVINTIQTLDIKATYDNMNSLLGCVQTLVSLREEITAEGNEQSEGVKKVSAVKK